MQLDEQLKNLSFQMMLNETMKMQIENSRSYAMMTGNDASLYSSKEGYHYGLMKTDKVGYELSLQFNELLFKNGRTYNSFENGPDAVNISAENLLYKYDLRYPISWYVEYEDRDGLHFGYYDEQIVDENHVKYLIQVENLLKNGKIDNFTKERLVAAGEYYCNHHKLLSKYFGYGDEKTVSSR